MLRGAAQHGAENSKRVRLQQKNAAILRSAPYCIIDI